MKRTVIITGGTKGLGREAALAFGRAGFSVVALYSADEKAARELQEKLASEKISGCVLRHDVRLEAPTVWNCSEIQEAEQLVLINNACAAFAPAPLHLADWQEFENHFLVAVKGAWGCSRELIRLMLKKGNGAIVSVLTSAMEGPPPKGFAPYLAAKYALQGFTLAVAAEYAPRGIKIFSVSPGFMDTPLTQQWDARLREAICAHSSRITQPAEAAARILDLINNGSISGRGENYPI